MKPRRKLNLLGIPIRITFGVFYPLVLLSVLYVCIFLYGNSRDLSQRVEGLLADVLPGSIQIAELRLDPSLLQVRVFGAELLGIEGETIISVSEVVGSLDLSSTITGQVAFDRVEAIGGEVLIYFDGKGELSLLEAVTEPREYDPRIDDGPGVDLILGGITVEDTDVLVHRGDMSLLFEGVRARHGRVSLINDVLTITADGYVPSGRVVLLPELLELADPRTTFTLREYRNSRRLDPWAGAREPLETRYGDDYGALTFPLTSVSIRDFVMIEDLLAVDEVRGGIAGGQIQIGGWLNIEPIDKLAEIEYEADGTLDLPLTSPLISYFAEDKVVGSDERAIASLEYEIEGSLEVIGGEVSVEMSHVNTIGVPFDRLAVAATTAPGEAYIVSGGELVAERDGGTIEGRGFFDASDGTYSLDLWLDDMPSEALLGAVVEESETDDFAGWISTSPSGYSAGGSVGLHLSGDLDAKTLTSLLESRLGGSQANLLVADIGRLSWEAGPFAAQPVDSASLEGSIRLAASGIVELTGPGTGNRLVAKLGSDEFQFDGQADLVTERFEGLGVVGSVRSLRRLVDLDGFDAGIDATLTLFGPFADPKIRVNRLELNRLDIAGVDIGSIRTSVDVEDIASTPLLHGGHASVTDVRVAGFDAASIEADYDFDGQRLSLSNTRIEAGAGRLDVDGQVTLFEGDTALDNPRLSLSVESDGLDINVLLPGQPIEGSIGIDATVRGTVDRPRIEGEFEANDVGVFNEAIDEASGHIEYGPEGVSVTNLAVFSEGATATGEIHLDRDFDIHSGSLQLLDLSLSHVRTLEDLGLDLEGLVDLWVTISRQDVLPIAPGLEHLLPNPGIPDVEGTLLVEGFHVNGDDYGSIALTADTYGDSVIAVGQVARFLDTRVTIPLVSGDPIVIRGDFGQVPLVDIVPSLEGLVSSGEASDGEFELFYDLESGDISSFLELGAVQVMTQGREFGTSGPLRINYVAGYDEQGESTHLVTIPQMGFGTGDSVLTLDGQLRNFSELEMSLVGEADMSLATLFSDTIADAAGFAEFDLTIGGTVDVPAPAGSVTLSDAELTVRGLGDSLILDQGVVLLEPEPGGILTVRVPNENRIVGSVFEGAFSLDGAVRLESFVPQSLELALDANNVTYRVPQELSVTLNRADLSLFGFGLADPEPGFFLSGNVFIEEALYFKDIGNITGAVSSALVGLFDREVQSYERPIWESNPLLGAMQFDLGIQARDGVFVRNEAFGADVEAEMQVNLQLRGTLVRPELTGDIQILEGEVNFQNRIFTIRDCTVLFQGRTDAAGVPVPYVDSCVAEASIARQAQRQQRRAGTSEAGETLAESQEEELEPYIIQVTAEGYLDDVELRFDSVNYALVQADIVSLIFLGVTVDEVGSQAAGEPSLDLVVRQLVALIEAPLEERLPFDELSLSPTVSGATTVYISQRLGDQWSYAIETTVFGAEEDGGRGALQYRITDPIILELSLQNTETVEVDTRLRFRFELD